ELSQMIADELVVLEHRVPVTTDVLARHRFCLLCVAIAEHPARENRRRRVGLVHLAIDAPVVTHLFDHGIPRLLRDDKEANPQLPHDVRRFWRHCRRIGTTLKALEWSRTDIAALLLDDLAVVLAPTALESLNEHLRGFDEAFAGRVLVDPEALEL